MTVMLKYCLGRNCRVNSEIEECGNRKQINRKENIYEETTKKWMESVSKRRT
jgi:hypothetical protein